MKTSVISKPKIYQLTGTDPKFNRTTFDSQYAKAVANNQSAAGYQTELVKALCEHIYIEDVIEDKSNQLSDKFSLIDTLMGERNDAVKAEFKRLDVNPPSSSATMLSNAKYLLKLFALQGDIELPDDMQDLGWNKLIKACKESILASKHDPKTGERLKSSVKTTASASKATNESKLTTVDAKASVSIIREYAEQEGLSNKAKQLINALEKELDV